MKSFNPEFQRMLMRVWVSPNVSVSVGVSAGDSVTLSMNTNSFEL